MRKFRNRRRLLTALACGVLTFGVWLPAQAGKADNKKCDSEEAPGNENSRKNCPPPSTTTSSSTSTSTSTTTSTTMLLDTAIDEVNDTLATAQETIDGTSQEPELTYPDIAPDVRETTVRAIFEFDESGAIVERRRLFFDTWAQNLGDVALDLTSDDASNLENPRVSQCISWNGMLCRERKPVGGFEVHPGHGHFHFEDFASYELRYLLPDGTPDFSPAGLISASDKVSYCLVDIERLHDDADRTGTYATCNAHREGISAGWADVYHADLEGQSLLIEGLPDGRYGLVISMNPVRHLAETTYSNNRVVVTLEIDSTGLYPTSTIIARSNS